MYSLNQQGDIIFIALDKKIKLDYYELHYGLFKTEKEAAQERKCRIRTNRWLRGIE